MHAYIVLYSYIIQLYTCIGVRGLTRLNASVSELRTRPQASLAFTDVVNDISIGVSLWAMKSFVSFPQASRFSGDRWKASVKLAGPQLALCQRFRGRALAKATWRSARMACLTSSLDRQA